VLFASRTVRDRLKSSGFRIGGLHGSDYPTMDTISSPPHSISFREVLAGSTPASIRRLHSAVVTQIHA
jgi:hypothetical protein